jgi:hypothetical protein
MDKPLPGTVELICDSGEAKLTNFQSLEEQLLLDAFTYVIFDIEKQVGPIKFFRKTSDDVTIGTTFEETIQTLKNGGPLRCHTEQNFSKNNFKFSYTISDQKLTKVSLKSDGSGKQYEADIGLDMLRSP